MKREERLKLSPAEKLIYDAEKTIERAKRLQARYDKDRLSGTLAKPNPIFERPASTIPED